MTSEIAQHLLTEYEVGFVGERGALSGAVSDILQASGGTGHAFLMAVMEAVEDASLNIFASKPDDFSVVTEHPTVGTTCNVTYTFLSDKFRKAVAAAAYQRLINLGHDLPAFKAIDA